MTRRTIGYHLVKSTYGLWLPGDDRGHWSSAWDEQVGYCEPHMLHEGDPVRARMALERMKHPPLRFSGEMIDAIIRAVYRCVMNSRGGLTVAAGAVESTHMHLLIPYSGRDILETARWIADQTTRAVHAEVGYDGPVWAKGKWCSFVFEPDHWINATAYIENHNRRRGLDPRPYSFITHRQSM